MSSLGNRQDQISPHASKDTGFSDKSARLAIEAGPGQGFQKAITDMANADMDGADETMHASAGDEAVSEGIERVGVDDLAFAAKEMGIKRLVIVTPFGDSASMNTVLTLSRLLTEENHPVALLQLESEAGSPARADDEDTGAGWIDLLGGGRDVSDIIHRDGESRLHVTPSGGIDLEALDDEQFDDLAFYLKAFREAYTMTVVHAPLATLPRIEGLSDGETAIIVAASGEHADEVEAMAGELNKASNYDVLHLIAEADTRILH